MSDPSIAYQLRSRSQVAVATLETGRQSTTARMVEGVAEHREARYVMNFLNQFGCGCLMTNSG